MQPHQVLGFELLKPVSGETRYFVYTRWETEEHFQAWMKGSAKEAHSGERAKPVGTGSGLLEFGEHPDDIVGDLISALEAV